MGALDLQLAHQSARGFPIAEVERFLIFCPWTVPSAQIGQRQFFMLRDVCLQDF
jgi:hypothetical protein